MFDIGGVGIERASIAYIDLQAGQEYALEDLTLKTGRIAQNAEGKLEFATVAKRKARRCRRSSRSTAGTSSMPAS